MKIAIIGAGPAGIYTALFLKEFEGEVHLYEKNSSIGKKLSLTGGGKMNLGNYDFSVENFVSDEKNILKNIFKTPLAENVLSLFEELDTEYKWEKERAILKSENGIQEIERLMELLKQQKNLKLFLNQEVKNILREKEKFKINQNIYDYVVITTGSQVELGKSVGKNEAYRLALGLEHSLTQISPALCPILIEKTPFRGLEGIALECSLSDNSHNNPVQGDLIFTHLGISGPVVLDFTAYDLKKELVINFLPSLSINFFQTQIEKNRQGKIFLKTFLSEFLPKRFALWILEKSKIPEDKVIANLNKSELKVLIENLYSYSVKNPTKGKIESGWTVKGGVNLKDISASTLESKIHPNLFFAGEVLDITGFCGGFNISFAILSAKLVSEGILKE